MTVVATLTKVLHSYGDLQVKETMRFANRESAEGYAADMLQKRVKPYCGSSYTIINLTLPPWTGCPLSTPAERWYSNTLNSKTYRNLTEAND